MKKKLFCFFIMLLMLPLCFYGCGDKKFNPVNSDTSISLTTKQQEIYDEIETYAIPCKNNNEKTETLTQIKEDIRQASNDKLDIELSIGKLRIDKLILKNKLDKDIDTKEKKAESDKTSYKKQRDSITNIYYGTQYSYNSEKSSLQSKISTAFATYLKECRRIDNTSYYETGYKEELKEAAYQDYQNVYITYNSQISQLDTQWQNKQNYERYNNLYNQVDSDLQKDIQTLETQYDNKCDEIDAEISELIKKR